MSVGETTTKAKEWCNEARKILKLGSMFSTKGKAMSDRAATIAKDLVSLEKVVKSGKVPLQEDEVVRYVAEFATMSKALKEAAETNDADEVEIQFARLQALKEQLAVHLAKGTKDQAKAQTRFETTLSESFAAEKLAAQKRLNALKSHAGATEIQGEIDLIEQADKIGEAQGKHDLNKHVEARDLLLEVFAACDAARIKADRAVFLLKVTAAEKQLDDDCKKHPQGDLIEAEINKIQEDLIDAAKSAGASNDFKRGMTLLGQVDAACQAAVTVADDWTTLHGQALKIIEEFRTLAKHAQKAAFTKEIERVQKKVTAVSDFIRKKLVNAAKKFIIEVYWDCKPLIELATAHGVYVAKRDGSDGTSQLETLKSAVPTTSNDAIATQIAAIQKKLDDAEKKAGSRKYPAAMELLNGVKGDCAAAKLVKDAHAAYATELGIVEPLVLALPVDTDPAIGPESKAIRAKLALAKAAALPARGEYASAKEILGEVQVECVAAQKIADEYTKNKLAGETAVKNSDPALGLEELRKLWNTLKSRDADKILAVKLGEIEAAITEANTALTT